MIIELFGPPGAGKTTFSRALMARLRECGHLAELRLSYRPAEHLPVFGPGRRATGRYQTPVMRRFRRSFGEVLAITRHPFANSRDVRTAVHLVRLLPPKRIFASIKNSQYLLRLSHAWYEESRAGHVALFDQAFVQAVCSLALLARVENDTPIANALDYAPKSDVLIRLEAPLELLKARLHDRKRLQSTAEQLLEPDLETSLASAPMIDRLHHLLLRRGRTVLTASSINQHSLDVSVSMIAGEIVRSLQKAAELGENDGQGCYFESQRRPVWVTE